MNRVPAKIGTVIPAFNEAVTITSVVEQLTCHSIVIVVDDGSTDETARLALKAGAIVVMHAENIGYDAALGTGFSRACELDLDYVVTFDADGQHDPILLGRFVTALDEGAALVIGVRDRRQRISESIFSFVSWWAWGIEDPLCGMKGYKIAEFSTAGRFDRYKSVGTFFTIAAARSRLKITQLPVQTRPRVGVARFGSGLRANLIILRALAIGLIFVRPIPAGLHYQQVS